LIRQSTRNVEAFLKKTDIAYRPNPSKKAKFWWYAISVFFKNASTLRVLGYGHKGRKTFSGETRIEGLIYADQVEVETMGAL